MKENVEERQKNMIYDENEYAFTIVVEDTGEGELEVTKDTSREVMFINRYEKDPGHGEDVPKTFDGIMTSIAMFAISLIGLIGGVLFGKRQLKKAK